MRNSFRAAAFAAAAFGATIALGQAAPVIAGEGGGLSAERNHLDHAGAGPMSGPLGVENPDPSQPLEALVETFGGSETDDAQQDCLASAVYFEARGEPLSGQLAVADVVLNRVASPRYPGTICEVVRQPWQFSFVRRGVIPGADRSAPAWHRAVAVARIAQNRIRREVAENVLWYHADYVRPSWGRRLTRQEKIGLHIFYS